MDTNLVWSLVLFIVGLLIAVLEVVLPSGGLLAVGAIGCLGGSLACAYQISGAFAAALAGVEVLSVPAVVIVAFKLLPKTSLGRQLILSPPSPKGPAGSSAGARPAATLDGKFETLMGEEGVAATALRPSGTAELAGRRVSVVTSGEVIPVGSRIRVVLVEGNRIVVETTK